MSNNALKLDKIHCDLILARKLLIDGKTVQAYEILNIEFLNNLARTISSVDQIEGYWNEIAMKNRP